VEAAVALRLSPEDDPSSATRLDTTSCGAIEVRCRGSGARASPVADGLLDGFGPEGAYSEDMVGRCCVLVGGAAG
jgi:hypothetical protein